MHPIREADVNAGDFGMRVVIHVALPFVCESANSARMEIMERAINCIIRSAGEVVRGNIHTGVEIMPFEEGSDFRPLFCATNGHMSADGR